MLETRLLKHSRVQTRGADNPGMSMMDEVVCNYVCKGFGVVVCVHTCVCHCRVECPRGLVLQSSGAFPKTRAKTPLTSVIQWGYTHRHTWAKEKCARYDQISLGRMLTTHLWSNVSVIDTNIEMPVVVFFNFVN